MFFAEPIPAALGRKLGSHILTETMERRPDVGLESYDRFFQNQDTLPSGGFGNLIAVPLQQQARLHGNSVFLDANLVPFADQWEFLSSIGRFSRPKAEQVVRNAEKQGRVVGVRIAPPDEEDELAPWATRPSGRRKDPPISGPLPEQLELVLGNELYVAKEALPPALLNRIVRLAAFQNPEFYKAQAMRLPTYEKPRIISCAQDHGLHIGLPRGCLNNLGQLFEDLNIKLLLRDERCAGTELQVEFQGQLRDDQATAAEAIMAHDIGVLSAATAFGKTVVAAWLIAKRGVNTLVLVHRRQLMDQWIERLSEFLAIAPEEIGRFDGGKKQRTGQLDVATIQSLIRKGVVKDLVAEYGHLIIDECHHLSASSFEQVARQAKAKFVTGLSATVTRQDGHHPIIFMQCGPVRHRVDARQQAAARPFAHKVFVRPTAFQSDHPANSDARQQFHELYDELITDEARNRAICSDVVAASRGGRCPLVLTERKEHLGLLAERLAPEVDHLIVLCGGMNQRDQRANVDRLAAVSETEERVLLATGRYIGEGFDDARLDTLFLTLPISWRGTIAQYAGRLHRRNDRKREVQIYDYADLNVAMLAKMFERRCRGYESIGYEILVPASAEPGWPPEVLLPVDPAWKRDYAATVRRLALDGVDVQLAEGFAHTARAFSQDAEGADRARSASEAFLFRRLETLPATSGRFRLNALLPINFDGRGQMEVDLLCVEASLVVELDGGQHLTDADAYRRDRRKDALLQEHGYRVLRFLAVDVGTHLDAVLDTILRALANQRERLSHQSNHPRQLTMT